MKKSITKILFLFLLVAITGTAFAQEEEGKKDNTGTNPVNFTYDARFYNEWAGLNINGSDGSIATQTFEFRLPFGRDLSNVIKAENDRVVYQLGQKIGARMRMRYKSLNLENPEAAGFENSNVSGLGDIDFRLLTVIPFSEKFMLAPGLEVTFNTATHDALGYGKTVLTPMVFGVFPGLFGKGSLFVPGYQYLFDVAGDENRPDINRSTIDLYFVWMFKGAATNWLIIDPQVLIDHENDTTPMLVELEWGTMIKPVPGASVYMRPGVGFGEDRPYEWNFEFGLKFIWR